MKKAEQSGVGFASFPSAVRKLLGKFIIHRPTGQDAAMREMMKERIAFAEAAAEAMCVPLYAQSAGQLQKLQLERDEMLRRRDQQKQAAIAAEHKRRVAERNRLMTAVPNPYHFDLDTHGQIPDIKPYMEGLKAKAERGRQEEAQRDQDAIDRQDREYLEERNRAHLSTLEPWRKKLSAQDRDWLERAEKFAQREQSIVDGIADCGGSAVASIAAEVTMAKKKLASGLPACICGQWIGAKSEDRPAAPAAAGEAKRPEVFVAHVLRLHDIELTDICMKSNAVAAYPLEIHGDTSIRRLTIEEMNALLNGAKIG